MKFGFIGVGDYAATHLAAIENDPELELVSVFDVNPEAAGNTARRFGCGIAGSLKEITENGKIDAVIISSPNYLHFEHFKACAANGKHVLMNIPAFTDAAEAAEMVDIVKREKIIFMPGHNTRKNPAIVELKKLLDTGGIGDVHMADSVVSCDRGYRLSPAEWRFSAAKAPLLPFTQMGIVSIDLILYFWGCPESVSAFMTKRDGAGDAPDSGVVICKYADGRIAEIGCSYVCSGSYALTFRGSKGSVVWDLMDENSITLKQRQVSRKSFPRICEQHCELREFCDCIRNGNEPGVNALDAYNLAEFYDCIAQSVRSGQAIKFRNYSHG
ncbi:MAG: Gfo/Idh/MocA family oxidoreductase [Victivallaceae bacterium]|nr:Gfo/Idh/MocA family oxidoreductase [Victivallaceae bacterium]